MSFDVKNKKCAVCEAYLFEDDDVVCCPVCGAPHHRDCYTAVGHCGLEQYHGTDLQYSAQTSEEPEADNSQNEDSKSTAGKARICTQCGKDYPRDARFCPYCGYSEMTGFFADGKFQNINIIDDNADIGEGVTAKEASEIILVNNFRYISRFLTLSKNKKTSWNWAGFLLPGPWLAYRKMYAESVIAVVFMIISTLLTFPLSLAIAQLPTTGQQVNSLAFYIENLQHIGTLPLVLAAAGLVVGLAVRIVFGLFGDWFYKKRVILAAGELKKVNKLDDEEVAAARKKWTGASFLGFMISFVALEFIPTLILTFI